MAFRSIIIIVFEMRVRSLRSRLGVVGEQRNEPRGSTAIGIRVLSESSITSVELIIQIFRRPINVDTLGNDSRYLVGMEYSVFQYSS
jgi:hypothetical protein